MKPKSNGLRNFGDMSVNFGQRKVRHLMKTRWEKWIWGKGMKVFLGFSILFFIAYAVFAFLYMTVIMYMSGSKTSFLWFWPVTCLLAIAFAAVLFFTLLGKMRAARTPVIVLLLLFWLLFLMLSLIGLRVYRAGREEPKQNADYLVVLGAQVRGSVPSLVLQARIDRAAEYLLENPNTIAIASGGQGSGELISEAEAIRRGLIARGVEAERILLEDKSTSTLLNLRYSCEVMEADLVRRGEGHAAKDSALVIVTNDFHVFRGVRIAKKMGFSDVSGCGATQFYATTIQYYVRESIGLVLEFLRGTV